MICDYEATSELPRADGKRIFRCRHRGCTNAVWATDVEKIHAAECKGPECIHLGEPTGETVSCKGCPGSPRVHTVWGCAVHGGCLPTVRKKTATTPKAHKCQGCVDRAS